MKKKMSLMERVKIAERREAEAKRQAERDRKRFMEADLIAKGAMVWVSALARREGPVIHVSAEEIEKARAGKYKCRMVADDLLIWWKKDILRNFMSKHNRTC